LLTETSTQAQLLIPLVASLAFGLLSATVASLFMVPVYFTILGDLGLLTAEQGAGEQEAEGARV
jgi:HAE1 family hydrophobic/amphiphilic exporter-1